MLPANGRQNSDGSGYRRFRHRRPSDQRQTVQGGLPARPYRRPPPDPGVPRLGESISLHGTLGLRETYPEAQHFFTPKKELSIILRRQTVSFDFDFTTTFLRGLGFRLAGTPPPADLIHIDRSGFDRYLYDRVVQQPSVEVRQARISSIEAEDERVKAAVLDDGTRLETSYLFDATNGGRILAGPLRIERHDLSDRHRVVFTHFCREPGTERAPAADWRTQTTIVRLYRDVDGLDGVAWCIPLPDKMSVGVSLNNSADIADDALLTLAVERFEREGFHVRAHFPERARLLAFDNQYYIHDRAFGDNWMLVGPAFANVWWPSGTGVGAAVAASENAVLALRKPRKAGARYQHYMSTLMTIHRSLDGLLNPNSERLPDRVIKTESVRRNFSEAERWLTMPRLQKNPLIRFSGPVRPYVVPLLLRSLKICHVTEHDCLSSPSGEQA